MSKHPSRMTTGKASRVIELMAEYGAGPLWEWRGRERRDLGLQLTGLSTGLVNRLAEWSRMYNALPSQNLVWASDADELRFESEGFHLAGDLQRELGLGYQIIYRGEPPVLSYEAPPESSPLPSSEGGYGWTHTSG